VAHLVQVVQVSVVHAQVSDHLVRVVRQAVLQAEPRDSLAQVVGQPAVAVAVLAAVPQVLLVKAAVAVRARPVSQSVRSAKNLKQEAVHHHLVVQ
jgi:hypothetical protein